MQKFSPEFVTSLTDTLSRFKTLLLGRAYSIHNFEGYQPFFIVGSGRSGNTLMRRILQASPEVHIPPETYVLGPAISMFLRNRSTSWPELVYGVYSLFEFEPNFTNFEISLRPLVQQVISAPPDCRSLAFMLNSFYVFHGEKTGQVFKRWGDKTPLNTFHLGHIASVFPDAKFVNMIRDGADVIHSYVTTGLQPNLEAAASRWISSITAASEFARSNSGKVIEVRYEDLVSNPKAVTRRVCQHINIDYSDELIHTLGHLPSMGDVVVHRHHDQVANAITSENIGKGRRNLTREEKVHLQSKIGNTLADLGYAPLI